MGRIVIEFKIELAGSVVITFLLPIEIAEAEVDVGLGGRVFGGSFEFFYGVVGVVLGIESFAHEHVDGGGIGIAFE